jgi:pyruvate kinase
VRCDVGFGVEAACLGRVNDGACGEAAIKKGEVKLGDMVVVTAGLPVGKPGTTNLVTLLKVDADG